jgi:hypothetical protein
MVILGTSVAMAVVGAAEYRRVFVPPGYVLVPAGVGFIAEARAWMGTPLLPLTYGTYESVVEALPRAVRLGRAVVVASPVRAAGRAVESAVVVADESVLRWTRPRVVKGARGTLEAGTCLIGSQVAQDLTGGAADGQGVVVGTDLGPCTVVGVVADDYFAYWFRGAGVILPWSGRGIDPRLTRWRNRGVLNLLYERPRDRGEAAIGERLRSGKWPNVRMRLVTTTIPDYLFPERVRAAARTAGMSALLGVILGVLSALVMLLFDVAVAEQDLRVRHWLGETAWRHFRSILPREALRALGGVVPIVALATVLMTGGATARATPGATVRSALPVAVATAAAFALVSSLLRARALWSTGRRGMENRSVAAGRGVARGVLLVQACGAMALMCALAYVAAHSRMVSQPLGMALEEVVWMELGSDTFVDGRQLAAATLSVIDAVRRAPGVRAVSVFIGNPVADTGITRTVSVEGKGQFLNGLTAEGRRVVTPGVKVVGPDFVNAIGGRVIAGRDIRPTDDAGAARVVVVNSRMASVYWGRDNPIGQRVKFAPMADPEEEWATVIGVVSDIRHEGYRGAVKPEAYVSILQEKVRSRAVSVVVRGPKTRKSVLALQTAVTAAAPSMHIRRIAPLVAEAERPLATLAHAANLYTQIAILGCLSQVVAALTGALTWAVKQRRELGVRLALGANLSRVTASVARAMALAGCGGAALGVAAGYALTFWIASVDADVPNISFGTAVAPIVVVALSVLTSSVCVAGYYRRRSPKTLLRDL